MKLKKVIIDISIIALAFFLFTVWYQNSIKKKAEQASSLKLVRYYEIYLITTDKEYQYWEYLNKGASDMANAIGIRYFWDAPEERNASKQIEVIKNAVDNGADAILVAADDPKKISGVIEDAKARGVKVIYVDSPANEEAITTLATNYYEAGITAGQEMLKVLEESNYSKGSIGIVSVAEKENTDLRERGFRQIIDTDGRFQILDTVYTDGSPMAAQEAAEELIRNTPDLVALLATNEGTTEGVGAAIKVNDNKYIGIGYDRTDVTMQLLRDGNLKIIIEQNPYTMGYLGVAQGVAAIFGRDTGPDYINTGVNVLKTGASN